jgi:DNA (cytosine-5)-methyltransferase 1
LEKNHSSTKFLSIFMIGVDLFAGAGGLTLGAKQAGIKVVFAVESDPHAAETYAVNHPEVKLFRNDIRKLRKIPVSTENEQTVLFGGPPCQGFSTSNQRTRSRANKGNWMFREFVRLAKSWKPDWIVLENVKGIMETERGAFLAMILDAFKKLGYTVKHGKLDAAHFGVPQHRERLFVIGSRHGVELPLPVAEVKRPIPVKAALSDLPDLENGAAVDLLPYKHAKKSAYVHQLRNGDEAVSGNLVSRNAKFVLRRYKHVPQGGNWENIPATLMRNYRENYECHTKIYHRLHPDKLATVIGNYRKNMLIHPFQDRGLSVREAARIQSFPDHYKFCGSIGFQQQQVGNAVPPLLAKAVFGSVVASRRGRANDK